jgi:hypothetical protein
MCENVWSYPPSGARSEREKTCGPESLGLCNFIVQNEAADPAEKERALAVLEAACEKDNVCGCAALGDALGSRPSDSDQARGFELLATSCRAGADPGCQQLRSALSNCTWKRGSPKRGACAEAVRRGLLVEHPIEFSEVVGCWRLEATHYDRACVEPQRLLLRSKRGGWTVFLFRHWSSHTHDIMEAKVPEGPIAWTLLFIQAYQGSKGRGFRLSLRRLKDAWLYLAPLPAVDKARLEEEARHVPP